MDADNNRTVTPTVSRALPGGTLVELLYNGGERTTALAVLSPKGKVSVEAYVDLDGDERLVPYKATNNLLTTGCVLLPSAVGAFHDKAALVEEVRSFIHRHVDLSPVFEAIAAHYVLLTWVYDAFNELGYLRFRGDYGTGKTRALIAIGSVCYKPFFASGASTVSPIFHVLDAFAGTLVLDEADFRFSDATADLAKILNNGTTAGLPVLRTMTNRHRELNPRAFRVFGPKLVGMRNRFADPALESRFLTEETGTRRLRADIPIQLPAGLAAEAQGLRNKLLAWRFAARFMVGPDSSRLVPGIEPRLNQSALALLSLIDDVGLRGRVGDELAGEEARVLQERASSSDAAMLVAVQEALERSETGDAAVSAIAEIFNRRNGGAPAVSNKWVGSVLRRRLRLATVKSHGVYVVPRTERTKVAVLAARFGVASASASTTEEGIHADPSVPTIPPPSLGARGLASTDEAPRGK